MQVSSWVYIIDLFVPSLWACIAIIVIVKSAHSLDYSSSKKTVISVLISAFIALWFVAAYLLGKKSFYVAIEDAVLPNLIIGVLTPIAIVLVTYLTIPSIKKTINSIPLYWLVGIQFLRSVGIVFILLYFTNQMPGYFAWVVGLGDIFVAIYALLIAIRLKQNKTNALQHTKTWAIIAAIDLGIALVLNTLSVPGTTRIIFTQPSPEIIQVFPTSMLPAFVVPMVILSLIFIFISLSKRKNRLPEFES